MDSSSMVASRMNNQNTSQLVSQNISNLGSQLPSQRDLSSMGDESRKGINGMNLQLRPNGQSEVYDTMRQMYK